MNSTKQLFRQIGTCKQFVSQSSYNKLMDGTAFQDNFFIKDTSSCKIIEHIKTQPCLKAKPIACEKIAICSGVVALSLATISLTLLIMSKIKKRRADKEKTKFVEANVKVFESEEIPFQNIC